MYTLTENTIEHNGKVLAKYEDKVLIDGKLHLYRGGSEVLVVNASLVKSSDPADKPTPAPVKTTTPRGKRTKAA